MCGGQIFTMVIFGSGRCLASHWRNSVYTQLTNSLPKSWICPCEMNKRLSDRKKRALAAMSLIRAFRDICLGRGKCPSFNDVAVTRLNASTCDVLGTC